MLDAILLGALAQSSLILSGLVVYGVKVPPTVIGALASWSERSWTVFPSR
jgi:hypothetical protein